MLRRLFNTCLLRPCELKPSRDDMEVIGIFNPGAATMDDSGDEVVLLVRVAERPRQAKPGHVALPRCEVGGGMVIDQLPEDQIVPIDARVVQRKGGTSGSGMRLTSISHLRVVHVRGDVVCDFDINRTFAPKTKYEIFGIEDPRITRIDETFYITYVAVSPHGAATALASTNDFRVFERHGIIFSPENKDVLIFPERIGGKYVAIHRPNPSMHFAPPEMWLAYSDDLIHWGKHVQLLGAGQVAAATDSVFGRIGGGCPPIRTEKGWLQIYHGNYVNPDQSGVGRYVAAAFLMDLDDPSRIIAHSHGPIMVPEVDFETRGFVPDVVFPTGVIDRGDKVKVYYGAADTNSGLVGFDRNELLAALG